MCPEAPRHELVPDFKKIQTSKDVSQTEVFPTLNLCCPDRPKGALHTDIRNLDWEMTGGKELGYVSRAPGPELVADFKNPNIEGCVPDQSCPHLKIVLS
ncbi:hypothetical protein RLOC_00005409 [Lonchura striata]|uniref:Uncharacterized protein n=1 Tax=Lonchura striata TaxID=40157 RepID=A0A218V5Z1_9PASE|nr:hypothetical protein RLOC_00005409 [Lonchura striata domestica]